MPRDAHLPWNNCASRICRRELGGRRSICSQAITAEERLIACPILTSSVAPRALDYASIQPQRPARTLSRQAHFAGKALELLRQRGTRERGTCSRSNVGCTGTQSDQCTTKSSHRGRCSPITRMIPHKMKPGETRTDKLRLEEIAVVLSQR